MNDDSVDGLMKDRFAFGGEAGVAARPVDRSAGDGTDALRRPAKSVVLRRGNESAEIPVPAVLPGTSGRNEASDASRVE